MVDALDDTEFAAERRRSPLRGTADVPFRSTGSLARSPASRVPLMIEWIWRTVEAAIGLHAMWEAVLGDAVVLARLLVLLDDYQSVLRRSSMGRAEVHSGCERLTVLRVLAPEAEPRIKISIHIVACFAWSRLVPPVRFERTLDGF
ncbi:hypothetical protein [Saccharopolyspora endophytica]|uniref:Uncharacterized protein n=1 Tax=Saccharopolyspora endophytica TaxID=543886 RepID=A0ABS5DB02_9PSEU|nr:hypothetical protein [Saccharopolyspora endophytica]MBQ0923481.1 hypothetical protein [Saccharopolyspora endophytica]